MQLSCILHFKGSAELRKRVPFTFTSSPVSESLKQATSGVKKEKKLRIYTKNSWFDYFFLFCFVLFCFFMVRVIAGRTI